MRGKACMCERELIERGVKDREKERGNTVEALQNHINILNIIEHTK